MNDERIEERRIGVIQEVTMKEYNELRRSTMRKRKDIQSKAGPFVLPDYCWISSGAPKQSSNYAYVSPSNQLAYTLDNPNFKYQQECINWKVAKKYDSSGNGMGNVMPWLLSMCLLGLQQFSIQPGSNALSHELETSTQKSVSPSFRSSLRNYKTLISSHDELPGHITCISPKPDDNLLEKLSTTPEYSNHLYGSTPDSSEYFLSNFDRRKFRPRPPGRNMFKSDPQLLNQLETHGLNYDPGRGQVEDDYVGPAMELVFAWSTIDYTYDSIEARDSAIYDGDFIAENNLPLGLEIWKDKVFITLPKWKDGIPVTLAYVPKNSRTKSPKLRPYPNWEWHQPGNCEGLTSVFRVQVDECDRLWVLDSGKVNVAMGGKQVCPPAIFIFDLTTDTLIRKYILPEDQVKEDSLYTNIVVDIRNEDCNSAVAYASDVFRYGLLVYDFFKDTSFRFQHHYFYPDPLASKYELHGVKFQWTDGIFGIALSPVDIHDDRTLFFHPMSSFREFAVSTSILRDKRTVDENTDYFMPIGRPRAKDYGHSSGSVIDRNGVMFFNMVTRDSVWCWDTRKEYIPQNLGVIGTSNLSLVFPNDIKVDHEYNQNVWIISNRLAMYLYGSIDSSKINYRVFKANTKEAVKDTVCDPNHVVFGSEHGYDETC